jgi:hypothetical protein
MATWANFTVFKDTDALLTDSLSPATNITGWTLAMTARKQYGGDVVIGKNTSNGMTITNAAAGVFTVAILDTDTENLATGAYVYNVLRTDAGAETLLSEGILNLRPTSKP